MIRRPPRSTPSNSSAASDVYKRQDADNAQEITVNLPDVNAKKAIGEILTSANLTDYNSFEKPNIVKPASFKEVKINKGIMKVKLPAKSIVTLELQ